MPLTIRVLGAGVAGLAAAGLLARDGAHVTLIDRDPCPTALGTSLGLFGPAQRALARLGVLDEVRAASAAPREGHLRARDGTVLARVPAGGAMLVPRTDLTRILRAALPDSVRQETREVRDVRPELAAADLLVGADGVHSLVRRSGWSGSAARRHGQTVLRGTTDAPPPDISETWGGSWLFGITPLASGGTNWFASVPEHRSASVAESLAHLRGVVDGAHPAIHAVLEEASPERTLVHGILTGPVLLPVRGHAVLIGDAGHAMAPNLGHGANTALEDAAALAAAVTRAGSVRGALRAYSARRTVPDAAWQLGSTAMMRLATLERGARLRDGLLRALVPG